MLGMHSAKISTVDIDSFKKATADLYKQPEVTKLVDPKLVEMVKKAIADMPKA